MTRFKASLLLIILAFAVQCPRLCFCGTDVSGFAAWECRFFPASPANDEAHDTPFLSMAVEPAWDRTWDEANIWLRARPFLRIDSHDHERTIADMRELFLRYGADRWEYLAGYNTVFWGVTESRHLVDIINQTDWAGDFFEEDKLGQPMVSMTVYTPSGTVELFILPVFRKRVFPGREWAQGAWLWKLEALHKHSGSDEQSAAVAGFEYAHEGLWETDVSLAVLLEYLFEHGSQALETSDDNDLFFSLRLMMNDAQSTEILTGVITDCSSRASRFKVEASRRLGSHWTVEL
jgi:hypothetical protein